MLEDDLAPFVRKVSALRRRHAARDRRAAEVAAIRRGDWDEVDPGAFSDENRRPLVANKVDTLSRHAAAALSPLPTISCQSTSNASDAARSFADKRTKIASSYVTKARLAAQMLSGADQYYSYGLIVGSVDVSTGTPLPILDDPSGFYPVWNRLGQTVAYARVFKRELYELCAEFPELETEIRAACRQARNGTEYDGEVEITKYEDKDRIAMWVSDPGMCVLIHEKNPLGRCSLVAVQRPGLDKEIRGSFDDLIGVQLAKHVMQGYLLQAADQAVNAPYMVPDDVMGIAFGPNEVVRTGSPDKARRLPADVPAAAWMTVEYLDKEIDAGAISPQALGGSIDSSGPITGKGVQQLMAGYSQQIAMAQSVLVGFFEQLIGLCFEVDYTYFLNDKRKISGTAVGQPYRAVYTPKKDIAGDFSVQVTYGGMAGLDPNHALVYLLQGQGAGLFSKDYVRRNMAQMDFNPIDEEQKITIEALRESLTQGLAAMPQAIPTILAQGGDPGSFARPLIKALAIIQKGGSIEEVYAELYPEPEQQPAAPGQGEPGAPGSPAAPGGPNPVPANIDPAQASLGPGGRPDMSMLFAGLTQSGGANLQAGISRMQPTG